jgi:hypothetical protein
MHPITSTILLFVTKCVFFGTAFVILAATFVLWGCVTVYLVSDWLDAGGFAQAQSTTITVAWPLPPTSESVWPAKQDAGVLRWLVGVPNPMSGKPRYRCARKTHRAEITADCERDWEAEFPRRIHPSDLAGEKGAVGGGQAGQTGR